ncbi:MAG: aspartyl protease family protein [Alteripontixanthobacter sp.]
MIRRPAHALAAPLAAGALLALAVPLLGASPGESEFPPGMEARTAAVDVAAPDANTIVMDADRSARMTVPVTVEGEGPFHFMVDTGSQATAVTREMGERLALPAAGRATLVGMASRRVVDLVELNGLEIGTSIFDDIRAPVLERKHVGADGIIGLDNLQDFRVLLDFRDNSMSLAEGQAARDRRGYEIVVRARRNEGQLVITEALVEGVRAAVIIDTGSQASIGNTALQRRIRARRKGETSSTDVNGAVLIGEYAIARSLKIDQIELTNLVISYADTPAFAALGYERRPVLSLGMNHLRMFDRVAIDFDKRRVLFDMPPGSKRNRPRRFDLPQ